MFIRAFEPADDFAVFRKLSKNWMMQVHGDRFSFRFVSLWLKRRRRGAERGEGSDYQLGKPLGLCSNFSQTRIMRVALYPFATTAIGGLVQTYSRFNLSKEIL